MSFEIKFPLKKPGIEEKIATWWQVFRENEEQLNAAFAPHADSDFDIGKFMHDNFSKISPDMSWEFGPGQTKKHVFAIAPERKRDLEPLARMIADLAPINFKFFEICINRPLTEWDTYVQWQDGRLSWKSPKGIHFMAEKGEHDLINLVFYTKPEHQDERTYDNCYIMMESLLGEEVVRDWIGYVDLEESKAKGLFGRGKTNFPPGTKPVSELRESIAKEIAKIKNGLVKEPLYKSSETGSWSLLQMKPAEADDYARMDDLISLIVLSDGPAQSFYSGQLRFSSKRFSAHSEDFVFVKIDGAAEDLNMDIFEGRGDIEDALAKVLVGPELGAVVGGGTGIRYSYIFLAIPDLEKAVPAIRHTLQSEGMPRRSWILFNDAHRNQEWIGIWDDSPQPVLPEIK